MSERNRPTGTAMTAPESQYPDGMGDDTQAILSAIEAWRQDENRDHDLKHMENQRRMDEFARELLAVSSAVKTGFPDGDFDGHRRYHELVIAREEQRSQIRREVITHLLKTSTWVALGGLAIMLLRQLKDFILLK